MTTSAKKSTLCKVRYKVGPVNIGEILEINPPPLSREAKDVTNSDSTEAYSEWVVTTRDGGEVSLRCNMVASDAGQAAVLASYHTDTLETYEIVHPDGTVICEFSGFVVGYKPAIGGQKDSLENIITWRTSGKPTYFAAASGGLSDLAGVDSADAGLTLNPVFAGGTLNYVVNVANTITHVHWTPTAASHTITIVNSFDSSSQVVASGAQSGALTLGAAGTLTDFTITAQESGKSAKVYTITVNKAA